MPICFRRALAGTRTPAKIVVLAFACFAVVGQAVAQSNEVNVYTYREAKLIAPLFEAFTKETGIKVNIISASSGLEQRIAAEGANSPADILLTVDIGRLKEAVDLAIAQPIKSELLDKTVPPQYRDPDGMWYAISARPRRLCRARSCARERDHL